MNKLFYLLFFVASALFSFIYNSGIASACPYLECVNFTQQDKRDDCNYVLRQGFNEQEEQEILCTLWERGYDYNGYEFPEYELDINLSMDYNEIDNRRFLLASKILIFGLFVYLLFSITKSSRIIKWANAI